VRLWIIHIYVALFLLPVFSGGGGVARASVKVPTPGCGTLYEKLQNFSVPGNLHFLPASLREDLARVGDMLRADAVADLKHPPEFHPELKRVVDALQAERRRHVENAVALRAERRALRDRLLLAQVRSRSTAVSPMEAQRAFAEIEKRLRANSAELESLVRTLEPLRGALGLSAIAEAAKNTAAELNAVVILHDMHPAAAAQLSHKGVGKGMRFKFNSTDEGVIAGLVPYDQSLSAKIRAQGAQVVAEKQAQVDEAMRRGLVQKRQHRVGSLVAVKKDGTVKFVDEDLVAIREADIAWVLEEAGNDGGRPIISDVDPAAFGFARSPAAGARPGLAAGSQPRAHPTMGILTDHEREVVVTFNHRLEAVLNHQNDGLRYMTHGTEARNPNSNGPTGYPLSVFLPNGTRRTIERGPAADPHAPYRNFVREMSRAGYEIPVNPRWGWN